jgi:hypothetical protein
MLTKNCFSRACGVSGCLVRHGDSLKHIEFGFSPALAATF